jgi:uncharacterized membrane protein
LVWNLFVVNIFVCAASFLLFGVFLQGKSDDVQEIALAGIALVALACYGYFIRRRTVTKKPKSGVFGRR